MNLFIFYEVHDMRSSLNDFVNDLNLKPVPAKILGSSSRCDNREAEFKKFFCN